MAEDYCGKLSKIARKIDNLLSGVQNVPPASLIVGPNGKYNEEEEGEGEIIEPPKSSCVAQYCRICRRIFPVERIQVHEAVCKESKQRKRDERKAASKQPTEFPEESLEKELEAMKLSISDKAEQKEYKRAVKKFMKYLLPFSKYISEDFVQCLNCGFRFPTESFQDHLALCILDESVGAEAPAVVEEKVTPDRFAGAVFGLPKCQKNIPEFCPDECID